MTTFATGNPIGSTDARDLYDNAENLDDAMNGTSLTWVDRLGVTRRTWAGAVGYVFLGDYQSGIEVTSLNQVIRDGGEFWRVSTGTTLPYTTTGAGMPEGGAFVSVGDATLRQDLADAAQGGDIVIVRTGTGDQTLNDALDQRGPVFDTVADMIAAPDLHVGVKVRTLGYSTPGDGGSNDYEIVAAATGTDDGGSFIDLSGSGFQAKALFSDGFKAENFGASENNTPSQNTTALQSFFNFLTDIAPSDPWGNVKGSINGNYIIDASLDIGQTGLGRGISIFFHGKLVADGAFTPNSPMIIVTQSTTELYQPTLDCGKVAAGIDIDGGAIKIHHPNIWNFQDYGILLDGSFGDTNIYYPLIAQWNRNDPEFQTDANFDGHCIRFDRADCNVYGGVTKWAGVCLYFTSNALTDFVYDHHPFNGRPSGDPGGPRVNPKLVVLEDGGSGHLYDCYLDNGQVDMIGPNLKMTRCHYLINDAAVDFTDQYVVGIFANGQTTPFQTAIYDLFSGSAIIGGGQWSFISFRDNGPDSWAGDYTAINAVLADTTNNPVSVVNQQRYVQARNTGDPIFTYMAPGGGVHFLYRDVGTQGQMSWESGNFRFQNLLGNTRVFLGSGDNGIVDIGTGTIAIHAGGASKVQITNGALRPTDDNSISCGSLGLRWTEVHAVNDTIQTSDEREKQQIEAIPDAWLDAWADVQWCRYKWDHAVERKGEGARWHTGLIAQQVRDVFSTHGLDAFEVGLLCYDEWDAEEDFEAGNRYGVRYSEAQAMEAAYQRRELDRLRARLDALK